MQNHDIKRNVNQIIDVVTNQCIRKSVDFPEFMDVFPMTNYDGRFIANSAFAKR